MKRLRLTHLSCLIFTNYIFSACGLATAPPKPPAHSQSKNPSQKEDPNTRAASVDKTKAPVVLESKTSTPTKTAVMTPQTPVVMPTKEVQPTPVATKAPDPGLVPVFYAVGHMGRTLHSCDAGKSWIQDKSLDDTASCSSGDLDCDHHAGAGRGLAFSDDGYVVVALGWGAPGLVKRSKDGVIWENVRETPVNDVMAGLATGNGMMMSGKDTITYSLDSGKTWLQKEPMGESEGSIRNVFFAQFGTAARFFFFGENGETPTGRYSDSKGDTWQKVTLDVNCKHGNFVAGTNAAVMIGWNGSNCRSVDGGKTWAPFTSPEPLQTVVWAGNRFIGFTGTSSFESTDSMTWRRIDAKGVQGFDLVAYHETTKTFVAIAQGWANWYENQKFHFSTDGLNWVQLAADKAKGGHPINFLRTGFLNKSATCTGM